MNLASNSAARDGAGNASGAKWLLAWHVIACGLIIYLLFLTFKPAKSGSANYPRRPIKIVVPFKAGGGSDTFVRQIQKVVEEEEFSDMPLVVINRPGGSGTVGSRSVKNSRADGYTVLNLHDAIFTTQLSGKVEFGYDAFEPIALTGQSYLIIAVAQDSPYQSLGDMFGAAAKNPETVGLGVNMGSPTHFGGLLMEKAHQQTLSGDATGAKFKYIQVGGGQARYTDLIGGHIDASLFSLQEYAGYSQKKEIRALAIFSEQRQSGSGDVDQIPTAREQGFDIVHGNAQYWWAPKGTPTEAIDGFKAILERVMFSESAQKWFADNYINSSFIFGDEFKQILAAREKQLSSLDMRKPTDLPAFEFIVGGILFAFLFAVIIKGVLEKKAEKKPVESSKDPGSDGAKKIMAVLGMVVAAVIYVATMDMPVLGFEWTTAAFIFAAGIVMGRRKPADLLVLAQIALLTGLGMTYLFTRVFTIDLPGVA